MWNMKRSAHVRLLALCFVLVMALLAVAWQPQGLGAQAPPGLALGKLAIYYGFPSAVNGANGNVDAAVATFSAYDVVVFGDTLQLPQFDPSDPLRNNPNYDKACTQNSHYDHDNTVAIIQRLTQLGVAVYGYVSIGGENTARICPTLSPLPLPLTPAQIQHFVDLWKAMGVTGVFYDEAGYDFGADRLRQNAAVDYAHSQGLRVFINAFRQADIFDPAPVGQVTYVGNLAGQLSTLAMNPDGVATQLGPDDLSLLESYQIIQGSYNQPADWIQRADQALRFRRQFGTRFATVTTALDYAPDCGFEQDKFDYAWWSTLLYGFDYMGWGEGFNFSAAGACDASLPLRARPAPPGIGTAFVAPQVTHALALHTRQTTTGEIRVDANLHTGQFAAVTPPTPPGAAPAPAADLLHWWPADGSAQDIAGFSHGALDPGKSWFAPGAVGLAFSLDGQDDFIPLGATAAVLGQGPFTVDAWIRTVDDQGVIVQQRGSGYDGQYVLGVGGLWTAAAGKACWSTFGDGQFGFDFCSTTTVNDGAWHHVAGVRELDGTGRLYIDGRLDASQVAPPRTLIPLEVYLGADKRDNLAFFAGLIDEIAVANRALTADEIGAIASAGSAGRARPTTHGVWVFSDEISTGEARDRLVARSAGSGVSDLYVSVYRSTPSSTGRRMPEDSAIADLIAQAHAQGIHVWAAYGAPDWPALGCAAAAFPQQRMAEVVAYNAANRAAAFDGVILDVEPPEPQSESGYQALLQLYACTLDTLKPAGVGLQAATRFYWDGSVTFPASGNVRQRVYEHVVDMDLHQVVVMGYRDFAGPPDCSQDGITCLDRDEVAYASAQGRLAAVVAGLETQNCAPGCGPAKVTFYEEGMGEMSRQAGCVATAFAAQPGFGGFALHRYGDSYLADLPGWATTNPAFPAPCTPVDSTPPLIAPAIAGALGTNGWYVSDVNVTWSVVDAESPITTQSGCDPVLISADSPGVPLLCTAASAGGSASASVTIKRDATAPTISGSAAPGPNAAGWNHSDVTVSFTCADATSGIAGCTPAKLLAGEGAGQSVSGAAADQAGNSATVAVGNINIDKTPPIVGVTGVANGATYAPGSVPSAGCTTQDALSGVATPAALTITGGDAYGQGQFTATCGGALDLAGNSGAASVTYWVGYPFSGFFQPVDNPPMVNGVKAGQAIPLKFSLGGDRGLDIFALGYPASRQVACSSSMPVSELPLTSTLSSSGLQYDAVTGQYTYVWKSDKAWAGQCRELVLRLKDGAERLANFKFR